MFGGRNTTHRDLLKLHTPARSFPEDNDSSAPCRVSLEPALWAAVLVDSNDLRPCQAVAPASDDRGDEEAPAVRDPHERPKRCPTMGGCHQDHRRRRRARPVSTGIEVGTVDVERCRARGCKSDKTNRRQGQPLYDTLGPESDGLPRRGL